MVGRIVSGVAVGIASATVPLYQSEITAPSIRGRLVSLQQWYRSSHCFVSTIQLTELCVIGPLLGEFSYNTLLNSAVATSMGLPRFASRGVYR